MFCYFYSVFCLKIYNLNNNLNNHLETLENISWRLTRWWHVPKIRNEVGEQRRNANLKTHFSSLLTRFLLLTFESLLMRSQNEDVVDENMNLKKSYEFSFALYSYLPAIREVEGTAVRRTTSTISLWEN